MLSKKTNIIISIPVGIVAGLLYYWLVWESFFGALFGFESDPKNVYIFLVSLIFCIGFSVNFGVEFGFDNREGIYNLTYVLGSLVYITAYTCLLSFLIWGIINPVGRIFLIAGLIGLLIPAGKHFILIVFLK